ncbi:YbaK/proline-tRNA ligase associated domain-containing protein [Toxoplasma gondii RUB]|uniref:YbaK/proline-tRNA ligase associated domain-containing protein n=1 Tax=Toxoplasma gondii RUB TaxID=935652 RepID=A0A086LLS0_TOXGO|nr:YbaK/proline-tRNA ligase associated domain-containing protein [Toxoplasma gondii RUB]
MEKLNGRPETAAPVSSPSHKGEKGGTPSTGASQLPSSCSPSSSPSSCSPSSSSPSSCSPSSCSPSSPSCSSSSCSEPMEERMRAFLERHSVSDYALVRVGPDYYDISLQERANLLKIPSTLHLCKTVVMENTRHTGVNDKLNSKYYLIVVQYQRKVNGERVKDLVKSLNAERGLKLGNKKLNFNFCKTSEELTGFVYNAVTPFAAKTDVPVIVDSALLALDPPLVWLGGGEVDLKLRVSVADLLRVFEPLVGSVCFEAEAPTIGEEAEGKE